MQRYVHAINFDMNNIHRKYSIPLLSKYQSEYRTNIPQIKSMYNFKITWSVDGQYEPDNCCYDTNIQDVSNTDPQNPTFTKTHCALSFTSL